jgi:hypothetical protein
MVMRRGIGDITRVMRESLLQITRGSRLLPFARFLHQTAAATRRVSALWSCRSIEGLNGRGCGSSRRIVSGGAPPVLFVTNNFRWKVARKVEEEEES